VACILEKALGEGQQLSGTTAKVLKFSRKVLGKQKMQTMVI
jgi:hypothetical protein